MTTPKVSICCLCYNHEKYIRQCLDGIIMQQTSFPFEALVHDDASTDSSRQIILEYAEKYPAIIKPILQDENQYSKGKGILGPFLCPRCTGEYVAFCECDDYWTDAPEIAKGNYNLWRLMIDKAYQNRGHGKEAVSLALEFIKSMPCGEAEYCWLSYEPDNAVARQMYRSFGFEETGEMDGEELIAVLRL